jgi:hypothetical protein
MPANPRHLLVLGAIGLASVLVPASASAHSLRHGAVPTEASELPIAPVLLGLLALGLALGAYSYARARRATDKARAPTPLRITPMSAPQAWQPPLGPRAAEHEERQR